MSKRKGPTTKNRRRVLMRFKQKGSHASTPTRAQRKAKRKTQKASRRRNRA